MQWVQTSADADQSGPTLQISADLTTTAGSVITVPLRYTGNGLAVSAISFSLDLDQTCLAFDPSDGNQDGRPDAMTLYLPPGLNAIIAVDLTDEDGEVDVIIADLFPPFVTVPDRAPLLTLQLRAICQPDPGAIRTGAIGFSPDPEPSFGSPTGGSIQGTALDGLVTIVGPPVTMTPTPTTTPLPGSTPTLVPTAPTATPTLIPTALPTTVGATAVESFVAAQVGAALRLTWRTTNEVDTAGFYLYRKQGNGPDISLEFQPITPLLPGQGVQGGDYAFIDQQVQANGRYLYLLVEEKRNGARTEFIQLLLTIQLADSQPYHALLPLIRQ